MRNREGQVITQEWDALNRMTKRVVPGALATDPDTFEFTYDLLGRKTRDKYWRRETALAMCCAAMFGCRAV
jgi:YD repeat-containing protein